ncbi:MAG TPA: hypothetical protein ENN51_05080 [candidate division WOR-3 bacterium]|uniref:ParE-like toxin domain-containing protein n=1 Tax=candidate division WOR-3 bacterium TaxID=2052148 RepID=A0A7V0T5P3_UNCW3|nr:hypothetical protein [candidate division WOR-3 bacterium]
MNSSTTADFRAAYFALPPETRARVRRAFALWRRNPRHPALRFKKVGRVWSVRIGRDYRALALLRGDTLHWFWVGSHDDYTRLI